MVDRAFDDPRQAALYDPLDPDRSDLDLYVAIADELGARSVLDVGCGTGVLALLLADRGLEVTGVDPATGMLQEARRKPGAERVRWVHGTVDDAPATRADLATMTGNVAQVFVTDEDWEQTLRAVRERLEDGGHLVLETRVPARRAWESWTREATWLDEDVPGVGRVRSWDEVTSVEGELVTFRSTTELADGTVLTSESTLRFRELADVEAALLRCGFAVTDVRDAPDRPGREWVVVARAV